MPKRILVLDGHPDPDPGRFCHAIADRYVQGAVSAGHIVHRIDLADLSFDDIRTREDWESGLPPTSILKVQDDLAWAEHVVLIYPLWLGGMPARLKGLLEQCFRPAFAFGGNTVAPGAGRLKGRSARLVITMGMPSAVYRLIFMAHSVRSLKRNILGLVGIAPVRDTLIGGIEGVGDARRKTWLDRVARLGARAG